MAGMGIDCTVARSSGCDRIVDDLDIGGGAGGERRNYFGAGARGGRPEFAQHFGTQLRRCALERGDYYRRDWDWHDRIALARAGGWAGGRHYGGMGGPRGST